MKKSKKVKDQYNLIERILITSILVVAFQFSCPHFVFAQETQYPSQLGPVLVQISCDDIMSPQSDLNSLPEIADLEPKMVRWVTVTAYSSTVDQCDDSPFITANGTWVYDGLVATNFLPFGTKVKFPDYFGDKVFTVDDRMNSKYTYRFDVWMPTRQEAKEFGVQYLKVEIY